MVNYNYFNVTGNSAEAILVEGPLPQAVRIERNTLWVQNGLGIVLNSTGPDHCVVAHNTLTGAGLMGIYVTSPATPNPGKHILFHNSVSGFRTPISLDRSKHPGAIVR
jgi:hypothetical protein